MRYFQIVYKNLKGDKTTRYVEMENDDSVFDLAVLLDNIYLHAKELDSVSLIEEVPPGRLDPKIDVWLKNY